MANETPANPTAPASAPAPAAAAPAAPQQAPEGAAGGAKAKAVEKTRKALSGLKKLGLGAQFAELLKDLFSPDLRTRRVARYFILSVLGVVGVLIAGGVHLKELRDQVANQLASTGEQGKNIGDFIAKQAEQAKLRYSSQPLGTFTVEIKPQDGETKRPPGVMNLADLDVVVECDSKQTCDFVEDRMPQIRNLVTDVLTPMDRDELLSREGKHRLKQRIMDKLNSWLPRGKIQDLYFDKLIVS